MAAATGLIGRVLGTWAAAALRVPAATIALFAAAAVAALAYAATTLGVNTDTTDLIDASLPWRQDFIDFRATFPARDRNLAIVVDADSAAEADAFAGRLLRELEARPDLYRSVLLPGAGEFFEREGLLYLGVPELEALSDRLAAAQPLIGMLGDSVDGAGVVTLATRAAGEAERSARAEDFAQLDAELAATLAAAERGERRPLDWRALVGMGDAGGARRVVVLQPKLEFGRLQPASEAIAGLRAIVATLSADDPSPPSVRITGSVAMEHEELISVSRGAGFAAILTVVLVASGLYAVFGSWRLLGVALVTLLAGLAFTGAFAAAAVGHLNLLSVAFVVLNVGLGSDYVIHVSLRFKELCARGVPPRDAVLETTRGVGASLVLCAATTATGFYAFLPTAFEGVSELGLIAGTGVLLSLLVSVTLLPALLAVLPGAERIGAARTWLSTRPLVAASARPRAALVVTLLVALAALATLPGVRFDNNPINLRDPASESVVTLRDLAATGEAPLFNLAAIAPDRATAERWARELAALPEVRAATTADVLVPSRQAEKIAILEDTALLMGGDLTLTRGQADPAALEAALRTLSQNGAGSVASARAASQVLLERLGAAAPADRERALHALDEDLAAGLPGELERLAAGLAAQPFDRDALPEPLRERWIASDGRELVEIAPAADVSGNAAAERFVAAVRSVVPTATGLPVVYKEASATVVGAFQEALGLALLMVVVIVWLSLRSFRDMLLVVVPILVAAGVTGAATVWLDLPFNYANIIALPLLVGIGVDNGIHVVHRLHSETSTAPLFETSTMNAVLASGLTTIASFGTLAFSAHVGTASMGLLLTIGVVASMAASLVVLPAWLAFRAQRRAAHGASA